MRPREMDLQLTNKRALVTGSTSGKGKGGGWQKASTRLNFADWSNPFSRKLWSCTLGVGMPIRTEVNGRVSPEHAATITAAVATDASRVVRQREPEWVGEMFCRAFRGEMTAMFLDRYRTIGARVTAS
jgi:hypothetical protein